MKVYDNWSRSLDACGRSTGRNLLLSDAKTSQSADKTLQFSLLKLEQADDHNHRSKGLLYLSHPRFRSLTPRPIPMSNLAHRHEHVFEVDDVVETFNNFTKQFTNKTQTFWKIVSSHSTPIPQSHRPSRSTLRQHTPALSGSMFETIATTCSLQTPQLHWHSRHNLKQIRLMLQV